jgi:ribonuclease-3
VLTELNTTVTEIDEKIEIAEGILGYVFNDKMLIQRALTHPSATNDSTKDSYERMEFLGDALIGAFVSHDLYMMYPDADEGKMTKMKISVVSRDSLSKMAREMGLEDVIVFGRSEKETGKRGMISALGNVFEAIVAALVIDAGVDYAHRWFTDLVNKHYDPKIKIENGQSKSALQEYLQACHKVPEYELVSYEGPPHNRSFNTMVSCEGRVLGLGSGKTKKESENVAAKAALKLLKSENG